METPAEKLRRLGHDPDAILEHLAASEERLQRALGWTAEDASRLFEDTSDGARLNPPLPEALDKVVVAVRKTPGTWLAPTVLLAIGNLRNRLAREKDREAEEQIGSGWRTAARLPPSPLARALRRVVESLFSPKGDLSPEQAEKKRLFWLAIRLLEDEEALRASGLTQRAARNELSKKHGFRSKGTQPGWVAVKAFLTTQPDARAAWPRIKELRTKLRAKEKR